MDWLSAGDGTKLTIYIGACIAFFIVARWIASRSESSQVFQPPPEPMQGPPLPQPHSGMLVSKDVVRVVSSEKNVTVTLRDVWFDTFDVETGPPDPRCFCAEMTCTVTLSDFHLREWEMTIPVATPEGMRRKMIQEHWSTMYLPELLLVDHYDLPQICEALIDRVRSDDPDADPPPENARLDSVGS
jgi:hypothetical protein